MGKQNYIQSPFNYTGGKYKLLGQIIPLFPTHIETFVDLFCGGGNVGINVQANKVVFNDLNENVIGIMDLMRRKQEAFIGEVDALIAKYGFSDTSKNGYAFYGCNSSAGVASYNKERFLKLREDFNALKYKDDTYFLYLFVIMIFSFNNQIRFNSAGKFNLPVGKRDFNDKMREKLGSFVSRLGATNCEFSTLDFSQFDVACLTQRDFVYLDPPYLITTASYNEQNGWTETDEKRLLLFLDDIHASGVKFALSNVLIHKGRENRILQAWLEQHRGVYFVHHLDHSYSNCSYHGKNTTQPSNEVLIINYKEP